MGWLLILAVGFLMCAVHSATSGAASAESFATNDPIRISIFSDELDDDFFGDDSDPSKDMDLDDGFFEENSDLIDIDLSSTLAETPASEPAFHTKGSIKAGVTGNFSHTSPEQPPFPDHQGLSSLSTEADLEFKKRFDSRFDIVVSGTARYDTIFDIRDHNGFTRAYESEFRREARIEKAFAWFQVSDSLDLKLGRQIVVWGKSDNIRVTDVLNPLNMTLPGLTDIKDLREPVFMSRLDYYYRDWTISAVLLPENMPNQLPPFGSEFYAFPSALQENEVSSWAMDTLGAGVSLSRTVGAIDFASYLASLYDRQPFINIHDSAGGQVPYFDYIRVQMIGTAMNLVKGNVLYKSEIAYFNGIQLSASSVTDTSGRVIWKQPHGSYSRVDLLIGLEYSGFKNTDLSYEVCDRHYLDLDHAARACGINNHTVQHALRFSRHFINETLELSLLASFYGKMADDGGFLRLKAEYDWSDSIQVDGGVIFYESGSQPLLRQAGDNDKLFFSLTYSF